MKLNKKTAGAIIFAVLLLLLFFSKTIYTYNMPEVTGTKPKRGSLSKLEISSGIASWAETEAIYAVSGGMAGRVFVREGDAVEKDQILFEMDFDIAAVERRYAEIGNNIGKLEADINGLRAKLGSIRTVLAATESGVEEPNAAPPAFTGQAGIIALEISKAKLTLNDAQVSFEWGFLSRNDLVNAENNLKALLFKYSAEADDLALNLTSKLMDMENLKLSREAVKDQLRDYRNNAVIKAPTSGVVLNLPVERGRYFQENALIVSIGVGREFFVECTISLDNNFVNLGDTCELSNASHVLNGTVRRIKPSIQGQGKTVSISISSDDVSDGETFDVTFEKNSAASFVLVPNSAVNQDNDGYFLYQIKRRKGIMGNEYYLTRLNIFIGDSDRQNTAVLRGLTFFDPIVLVSSKALSDGVTVSLKNPEDFFES